MACIKTEGVTVVIYRLPGSSAAAASCFATGSNLDLPKDALKAHAILEFSHEVFVSVGGFGSEGNAGGCEVQVGILVRVDGIIKGG